MAIIEAKIIECYSWVKDWSKSITCLIALNFYNNLISRWYYYLYLTDENTEVIQLTSGRINVWNRQLVTSLSFYHPGFCTPVSSVCEFPFLFWILVNPLWWFSKPTQMVHSLLSLSQSSFHPVSSPSWCPHSAWLIYILLMPFGCYILIARLQVSWGWIRHTLFTLVA